MSRDHEPMNLARIARDNEGFLLDPSDWSTEIAEAIAAAEGQPLGAEHWAVIRFIRDSWETTEVVPEARKLLRHMKSTLGAERATRRYLYTLFPTGYGQTACKIAGMRKPLKLMLDV